MSLSLGIVGLPNVGKSTLFNALTKAEVLAANYPFATIEPNVGIVSLPDPRLAELAKLYDNAPVVPATVTFVDIAGIVKGASTGQGLGNKFLANIRECDAIVQVVRVFTSGDVIHVDGKVDPADDIATIITELVLADLATIDNRLSKKGPADPALQKARDLLDTGKPLFGSGLDAEPLRELQLLTAKPFIYVFNLDEADLGNTSRQAELAKLVAPAQAVFLCAQIEAELKDLEPAEAQDLLSSLGQSESGLDQLAHVGFTTLGLQTFLTAGPKEARAWTIRRGATAPEAAGVIHTDFTKKFIKAEVVSYDDLIAAGSLVAARAAGKARLEGKDYVMQDGDVVEFRIGT